MDSLGEYFREEREAQGLTFEELVASTKNQESYLRALEDECFNLLPQKVFAKGFVRTYARALGLDEEEAVRLFWESARSYYQKEEEEQQQIIQREEDDRKGKADRNAVSILTGVILIGLVFIIFILSREQSSSPSLPSSSTQKSISPVTSVPIPGTAMNPSPSEMKIEDESDQDVEGGGQTSASLSTSDSDTEQTSIQVAAVSESEATSPRPVQSVVEPEPVIQEAAVPQPDGPIMLQLEALEITWVVVRSDDLSPHEALLQPGERALWRAHKRFLLTLGNAGGVKVTLNGEPRGPFGEHGTVIRDLELKP